MRQPKDVFRVRRDAETVVGSFGDEPDDAASGIGNDGLLLFFGERLFAVGEVVADEAAAGHSEGYEAVALPYSPPSQWEGDFVGIERGCFRRFADKEIGCFRECFDLQNGISEGKRTCTADFNGFGLFDLPMTQNKAVAVERQRVVGRVPLPSGLLRQSVDDFVDLRAVEAVGREQMKQRISRRRLGKQFRYRYFAENRQKKKKKVDVFRSRASLRTRSASAKWRAVRFNSLTTDGLISCNFGRISSRILLREKSL